LLAACAVCSAEVEDMFEIQARLQRGDFNLNVDIRAPSTGVLALFGRSGCGKTTLAHVVAGLLTPDSARVAIDDSVLEDTNAGARMRPESRRIGYVFQDARLFPHMNVARNLEYGQRRTATRNSERWDHVITLLGLEGLLQRRVHRLSGGERQRVALGRALLAQPRLLILDEPLSSLDAARRNEVLPYLERLRDELALPMIYVSHDYDEVLRLADHVVLLDAGQVVAQGELADMSVRPELRAIVGADAIGAVLAGEIASIAANGLAIVRIGNAQLTVTHANPRVGMRVRVQLLARDLILAMEPPRGLSVRNIIEGRIVSVTQDDNETDLVRVDIGGAEVLSRVTHASSSELGLSAGVRVWVLVKTVSMRGHTFARAAATNIANA
jgi:molybdate transport system ATP-binding protein